MAEGTSRGAENRHEQGARYCLEEAYGRQREGERPGSWGAKAKLVGGRGSFK